MASRICFAGLAFALVCCAAASPDWKPCGPQQYFATREVQVVPDPPQIGKDITFKIWGTTDLVVTGGVINIDISYMGVHIFSEVKNLCDKTACPIPSNQELELDYTEKLPGFIPPGKYDMTITVTSVDGEENLQLFCMVVNVDIVSKSKFTSIL